MTNAPLVHIRATDGDRRPVLVGIDGSSNAEAAAWWAADVARATGRPLRVLTSYALPTMVGMGMAAGYVLPALKIGRAHV